MQISVLEYLEQTARAMPEKTAFADESGALTFARLREAARAVGSALAERTGGAARRPVVVFQKRRPETVAALLGAVYAGCFYVALDPELPRERLEAIVERVRPVAAIVMDDAPPPVRLDAPVLTYAQAAAHPQDEAFLEAAACGMSDQDPLYVLFTSGTTGAPKGVVTSHRAVIDYIDAFSEIARITADDVLGSQAPLDYVAALRDIYLPLKLGAQCVLLPKKLFSLPARLFEALDAWKITTLCWVVPALCIPAKMNAFATRTPATVDKVFFTGSVMPAKYLRMWQQALPRARFVNHYGPTEITASCTWAEVGHVVGDGERLPIGRPFRNTRILLLDDEGREVSAPGETGEICVAGCGLALGYFDDPGLTAKCFVQNPLHCAWPERIYRTGDYAHRDADGVLWFHGRRDSQIKFMGHRVEMEEIELAARALAGVEEACCFFEEDRERLHLFVQGEVAQAEVFAGLRERLPAFMVPRRLTVKAAFALLPNGKVDRAALRAEMEAGEHGAG